MLTDHEISVLTKVIKRHRFLDVIDEATDQHSVAVLDRRAGLCVCIDHPDQIDDLVKNGAEWYLSSPHNFTK